MMDGMTVYRLVGGTRDGERVETDGSRILRVPIVAPVRVVYPRVTRFRNPAKPSLDIEEYERFGDIYWWEGLTRDAWGEMAVSDQVFAEGGAAVRRLIREQMRANLSEFADGKDLWRIVWRVKRDPLHARHIVRALVGPRAVPFGLRERAERRGIAI